MLLSRGVDVNARNRNNGVAPIHDAADNNKFDMIRFLAERGADLSPVDRAGTTPYQHANCGQMTAAMEMLVKLGAPR